jgi:hypothetical protein
LGLIVDLGATGASNPDQKDGAGMPFTDRSRFTAYMDKRVIREQGYRHQYGDTAQQVVRLVYP